MGTVIPGTAGHISTGSGACPPHDISSRTHIAAGVTNQSNVQDAFLHPHPGPAVSGHQSEACLLFGRAKEKGWRTITQANHSPRRPTWKSGTAATRAWMAPKDVPRVRLGEILPALCSWEVM